jgi:glycosyltransferase involved in cell wall biosynthesis
MNESSNKETVPLRSRSSITLVVPALNEERVVRTVVEQILAKVEAHFVEFEVILIDDGSTDATGRIMDEIAGAHARVRALHNPGNIGLGASYKRGLAEAKYEYLMLLCGDGGLPAKSLPAIFSQIGKADIVIPFITNLKRIKSPVRFMLSRGYTRLLNMLFGLGLQYYNGLPVHRTELLRCIQITSSGFGFQGEILVKLLKSGCSYVEVGVPGAEETRRSFALRPRNLISVARTVGYLIWEIARFKPIPAERLPRARVVDSEAPSKPVG